MKKIIYFDTLEQFKAYRKTKANIEIGDGSEGVCFRGKDGLVYKDLTEGFKSDDYVLEEVITSADCHNKSFIFPHTLFVVGNELVGYTSDLVFRDDLNHGFMMMNGLNHIDFDKLIQAYSVFMEDAVRLSKDGIRIYDLSYNLMFDGERLFGIDTCGYSKSDEDVLQHNILCVNSALKDGFGLYAEYAHREKLDKSMDVVSFLRMVEAKYTNHGKGKMFVKK